MTPTRSEFLRIIYSAGLLLSLVLYPAILKAHAVLMESNPADGSILANPPSQVVLRFNARIEKSLARFVLAASTGKVVPLPIISKNISKGDAPDRLVVPLPRLQPGAYTLRYKVLATDGHATQGILRFSVTGGN